MKKFFKSIWEFITGIDQLPASDNTYEVPKLEPKEIRVTEPTKPIVIENPLPKKEVFEALPKVEKPAIDIPPLKKLDIKIIDPSEVTAKKPKAKKKSIKK